ncbi:hypothetical protein [Nitrosomonas sp. ANs5]
MRSQPRVMEKGYAFLSGVTVLKASVVVKPDETGIGDGLIVQAL